MKKGIVIVLTVLFSVFLFSGCSQSTDDDKSSLPYTTKEIWCNDGERRIFGEAYIPEGEGRHPLVIFSHELGSNHESGTAYAKRLTEKGYAFYSFDFCGGSAENNRSDGDPHDMSLLTEKRDLAAVIKEAKTWDFVNPDKIILMGGNQGAIVSALCLKDQPEGIRGLIMLYPAFNIEEEIHSMFEKKEDITDEVELLGGYLMVGRKYAEDIWDMDLYEEIKPIDINVLILHGNSDTTTEPSYSDRASKTLKKCEYHVIEDAGHEFSEENMDEVMKYISGYLDRQFKKH